MKEKIIQFALRHTALISTINELLPLIGIGLGLVVIHGFSG